MAVHAPSSTTWYATDQVHSITVTCSGHWTIWRGTRVVAEDDSLPARPRGKEMTREQQKEIGYRELRAQGLTPVPLTGD